MSIICWIIAQKISLSCRSCQLIEGQCTLFQNQGSGKGFDYIGAMMKIWGLMKKDNDFGKDEKRKTGRRNKKSL